VYPRIVARSALIVDRYPRICRNGHTVVGPQDEVCADRRCRFCKIEAQERHASSSQGAARIASYENTERRQRLRRAAERRYKATAAGRIVARRAADKNNRTPNARAARARWQASERGRVKQKEALARYRATPKGKAASIRNAARRKAKKLGNGFDYHTRDQVWERDGGICQIGGEKLDPANWHEDHIIPLALGGPDTLENVQASCPACNLRKGKRTA
jgi:5-methylcytosine-specific restriction endonuclease McrA